MTDAESAVEFQKAFAETHNKMMEERRKLLSLTTQIGNATKQKNRATLTLASIQGLDANVRAFEGIGQLFVLSDVTKIREELKKQEVDMGEALKSFDQAKEKLENSIKDDEKTMRELVHQWKSKPDS